MGQKFIVDTMIPLFYKSDSENIYDMNPHYTAMDSSPNLRLLNIEY